jgi:hypothetical protein
MAPRLGPPRLVDHFHPVTPSFWDAVWPTVLPGNPAHSMPGCGAGRAKSMKPLAIARKRKIRGDLSRVIQEQITVDDR